MNVGRLRILMNQDSRECLGLISSLTSSWLGEPKEKKKKRIENFVSSKLI